MMGRWIPVAAQAQARHAADFSTVDSSMACCRLTSRSPLPDPTCPTCRPSQVDHLHSLLELLVRKEPQLLPDFLPEVLELQVGPRCCWLPCLLGGAHKAVVCLLCAKMACTHLRPASWLATGMHRGPSSTMTFLMSRCASTHMQ